jgi:predicted RNase H-like HicB family nuclease
VGETAAVAKNGLSGYRPAMRTIHAVFQNDGGWFIARCLDFPVTTQGKTLAAAKINLQEAVELYLETWGASKPSKSSKEVYLTSMEVAA